MRKTILIFLIILTSCENENSSTNNFTSNEFVKLFPTYQIISNLELENNESIFIYNEWNSSEFKMSLLDKNGEIVWTKAHNRSIAGVVIFMNENLIYNYHNDSNGVYKSIFDLNGNLLSTENILNESVFYLKKGNNNIYAIKRSNLGSSTALKIEVIEFSLDGTKKRNLNFETNRTGSNLNDIIIKNNNIYIFGESDFQSSPIFYSNYFCDIYDFSGKLIKAINTETLGGKSSHSKLVLNNGNILMSIFNFNKSPLDYDFRLFNSEGTLIKSLVFKSPGNALKLSLFKNDMIGVAGSNIYASSSNSKKKSQFVILDQNLEKSFNKELGSIDKGEIFLLLQEFDDFYYLVGNTDGTDGDFNIPNNSSGTDLFYIKLKK